MARAEQGYEVDQIANDIGMSRQNVDHYMRVRDQMKVAADGLKRLQIVGKGDWTVNPQGAISTAREGWFCKTLSKTCETLEKSEVKSSASMGNGVTVAQQTLTLFV
jgi:hypothetical protein